MAGTQLRRVLELGLHPTAVRLHRRELRLLERELSDQNQSDDWGLAEADQEIRLTQRLTTDLRRHIENTLRDRAALGLKFASFRQNYARAVTDQERREQILALALALGAGRRKLNGDRRAFDRWFGYDAISERFHRRISVLDRRLTFALGRLGVVAAHLLAHAASFADPLQLWRRLELEPLLRPLFGFSGNTRIRIESFRCLSVALQALPAERRETGLSDKSLQYIYRTALERSQDTWLQCEALTLLRALSPASLDRALRLRLEHPEAGDDLFLRRHALRLLGEEIESRPHLSTLLEQAAEDPSPAVRQAVAGILSMASGETVRRLLPRLLGVDNEPAVRAAAVLSMSRLCCRPGLLQSTLDRLQDVFEQERDSFVLRVALEATIAGYCALEGRPDEAKIWLDSLLPQVARLHSNAEDLAVRRWSAQARERLWGQAVPEARALVDELAPLFRTLSQSRARSVAQRLLGRKDGDAAGRALALLAQTDFGFDVEQRRRGVRITRGHRFGFRLWRFLYEFRNPGTDKRQAFPHTTGRLFRGTVHAASAITAELAETKVPGEPLFFPNEAGWRPYLPLVDEMISVLDQPLRAGPLRLYTSEGVTEVAAARSLWRRLRARLLLTLHFSRYARLRNWQEGGSRPCQAYLSALKELGFSFRFRAHESHPSIPTSADPAVTRFFPAGLALPGLDTIEDIKNYFFSVYENSLQELALFVLAMSALFFGRHIWVSRRIGRLRERIPLSIGGWGTRGKSGTERLKAALFNALGHTVVSKTTGCEAMFLHGPANGTLREMFLFRPYDKATIWEQANVVRLATKLDVDVFLWECMGLTPAYVAILQQQWMRDDIATITNTYPDHEDLQGPAGVNIPQVMTNFIPRDSILITTEEQMLPILRDGANHHRTRLRSVGWLEAGMLTSDLLSRFPYAEHPYNIALVLDMAEELGIDADFALKEMADRVVADLGVLKALPVSSVQGRRLEFINGMSANERFGCLGNWTRMGFEEQNPYTDPGVWLTTVVNNRADRVPRSKVFASILVRDIGADRHFVIGTNLDGFMNYVREAWDETIVDLSLADKSGGKSSSELLDEITHRFRIPYREEHLSARLQGMLEGLGVNEGVSQLARLWAEPEQLRQAVLERGLAEPMVPHLLTQIEGLVQAYREYSALAKRIADDPSGESVEIDFHQQLWAWFERKIVVIEDPHASGNQIIDRIIQLSPPGLLTRIMGMQNIKGTGLDFVYRWQAWEACNQACQDLCGEDRDLIERGLRMLAGFQEYNALCEETVRSAIERVKGSKLAQNEWFQAELTVIVSHLDEAMRQLDTHLRLSGGSSSAGLLTGFLAQIEAFLDAGDAVKRRKRANLIYRELAVERISHERAALELQALNKRQKGGWLQKKLETLLRRG